MSTPERDPSATQAIKATQAAKASKATSEAAASTERVDDGVSETAALRARVAELEAEVAALRVDTVQLVASAQETLYWFERWGIDFNSVMSRPEAEQLRRAVRAVRTVYRTLLKIKRRLVH